MRTSFTSFTEDAAGAREHAGTGGWESGDRQAPQEAAATMGPVRPETARERFSMRVLLSSGGTGIEPVCGGDILPPAEEGVERLTGRG